MTNILPFDWALMTVSLFNTILLLWLGLTVLLNAERRGWGVWLVGGGLLMGGSFFVSHSAILGHDLHVASQGLNFWWRVGWIPVIALPYAWYLVILWYAGFWEDRQTDLNRRQRLWFAFTSLLALSFAGLLLFANPLPSYWRVAQLTLSASPSLRNVPALILLYPLYILLCMALSLDGLRRPGPSARMMGNLARRRARPWLTVASLVLLLVSLLVVWAMFWIVSSAQQRDLYEIYDSMLLTLAKFDLVIESLIGLAVILMGQAIVSYEVFTGKTLPRRGLRRHWHRAVILAAGYSIVVGLALSLQLRPIYSLLLTAILMTFFYALLSWRSYVERERTIDQLRPFIASQRLYESLLNTVTAVGPEPNVSALFRALCSDVLGARLAYLVPLGPLAPLAGAALAYPDGAEAPPLTDLVKAFDSPQTICLPLSPQLYQGALWAVPLWSERGVIGALLLGEKRDGGLYSQEEIEVARASGERLIDTLASTEMAQRLMALQRQRLAENQVVDQRARRVLHDDVLPLLHTMMLTLQIAGDKPDQISEVVTQLAATHRQLSDLLREMPMAAVPQVAGLGLIGALRQVVDQEWRSTFDQVGWQIDSAAEAKLEALSPLIIDVLFYAAREAIRNAARHAQNGDTERPLHLSIRVLLCKGLEIQVEDDGSGIKQEDSGTAGGGQGLTLHSTMMAVIGGTLAVESKPGVFTRVRLTLPPEKQYGA